MGKYISCRIRFRSNNNFRDWYNYFWRIERRRENGTKRKKYITWEGLNQHAKNVGKKIKEYDAGVIGGYNGSFPLTAATKGNIYLLPATKKYYVCIENYNGSQLTAPNANFEELSVYTNRSKLDNLSGIKEYNYLYVNRTNNYPQNIGDTIVLSESYSKYHFINIEVVNSGIFREYLIPTQELTQIENLNYKYNINGFILKPSKDGTTLSIVDIPKDGYKKLNIIAGILKK